MTYRVALAKRAQEDGSESAMDPSADLDVNLADGVVAQKVFVERLESEAQHSQEELDEDDGFLASAMTEVWDYEVVDSRAQEFEDALRNSERVIEFEVIDEDPTDEGDLPETVTLDNDQPAKDAADEAEAQMKDSVATAQRLKNAARS